MISVFCYDPLIVDSQKKVKVLFIIEGIYLWRKIRTFSIDFKMKAIEMYLHRGSSRHEPKKIVNMGVTWVFISSKDALCLL